MNFKLSIYIFVFFANITIAQNLVVDGAISNNVNWNGQEAPWNGTTYQNSYLAACGNNYVMEVDAASVPTQTLNGFSNGANYVLSLRYAYRTVGCGPSNNPTFLRIRFTDATSVLDYTLSIANTVTNFLPLTYTFTNNASTSHTLEFSNLGNVNTCGVIVDDISIVRLSSPGGVGASNLSIWFKAETIGQSDNTDVYGWNSLGASAITATAPCAARPVYRTGLASAATNLVANFNPYVTFNGTTRYLAYETARLNLFDASAGGAGGSVFTVFQGGGKGRTYFGHRSLTTNSRIDGKADSLIFADGGSAGTSNAMQFNHGTRVNIAAVKGKANGYTLNDWNGTSQTLVNHSADNDYLTIGVRKNNGGTFDRYYDGSVSEVMVFNSILSNTQMHQVRSYLATKYGVTLSNNANSAGLDERTYLASNGTTAYWDFAANSGYHNNVTIIGRDDATGLDQRRSISTDADAGSNTGNAMVDIDNAGAFSSDKSFLAIGHNGTVIPNPGGADFIDVPATIQSRLKRFWKFQKTGTGVANNVSVRFDMTGFAPLTGSNLRLLVSNSTSFAGATIIAGAYAAPYFTASLPTTGGVYFTVASTNSVNTPLPISLLEFAAAPEKTQVRLNWATSNELNSDYFSIERSSDAITFNEIGSLAAAGNSSVKQNYDFVDSKPLSGLSYYRLKQVDRTNSFVYSNAITVLMEGKIIQFALFPNPSKGKFTLNFAGLENDHKIDVMVCNAKGAIVFERSYLLNSASSNQMNIDLGDKTAKGIYYCTVNVDGEQQIVKVIIE